MSRLDIETLFATPIAHSDLGDVALLKELEAAIWMVEEGDEAGKKWCEENHYDGYTSYASLDDLPRRASAFNTLKERLDDMAHSFADTLGWELSQFGLRLDGLWVNILGENGSHSGHIHPASVISGTVYIDMPASAGALKFEDPRLAMMQAAPPLRSNLADEKSRFVYRTPAAGAVLMWESWLRHEVMPHRNSAPRLTISFNYGLVEK